MRQYSFCKIEKILSYIFPDYAHMISLDKAYFVMNGRNLYNYIRSCRKNMNLTQCELGFLVGHKNGNRICRLETGKVKPTTAETVMFSILFLRPVSELWPEWTSMIEIDFDTRIRKLIDRLQRSSRLGSFRNRERKNIVLRKLEAIADGLPQE
jgi:hypothetical protein